MGATISECCVEREKVPDPFLIPRRPPVQPTGCDFVKSAGRPCRPEDHERACKASEAQEKPEQSEQPPENDDEEREEEEGEVYLSLVVHNTFLHYIPAEPEGTSRQRSESVPRTFQPCGWLCRPTCNTDGTDGTGDSQAEQRTPSNDGAGFPSQGEPGAEAEEVYHRLVTKNTFLEYARDDLSARRHHRRTRSESLPHLS
ncbi:unnamed protein product [Symbiodinium natans]|uniref:Uncharacterized protein n=1 Tax=Symbiodinium natans TaxID=878477 RepID=A0A812UST8_9DINO|nr:unnamed protein product [Symbiodinium natans]